jgi:hypothetical protein
VSLIPLTAALGFLQPGRFQLFIGLGVGAAATMMVILADSPPRYIESWREGAEGEKATAKALRRLTRTGWTLTNDVDTGAGNLDHALVGPAGVFVLESKKLRGNIRVSNGTLCVSWPEDPTDGYRKHRLARRVKNQAFDLSRRLHDAGVSGVSVQPIVVIWGAFKQQSVLSDEVAWVRGDVLAAALVKRPVTQSDADVIRLTTAVRSAYNER